MACSPCDGETDLEHLAVTGRDDTAEGDLIAVGGRCEHVSPLSLRHPRVGLHAPYLRGVGLLSQVTAIPWQSDH